MSIKTYYAIFTADGALKVRRKAKRGTGSLYTNKADAIRQADGEGDAVVPLPFDTGTRPIFIRSRVVDPNGQQE